jgi:hypothetical protein
LSNNINIEVCINYINLKEKGGFPQGFHNMNVMFIGYLAYPINYLLSKS